MKYLSNKIILVLAFMFISCDASASETNAPLSDSEDATEAYAKTISITETMVFATAEFENKLELSLEETIAAMPTNTPSATNTPQATQATEIDQRQNINNNKPESNYKELTDEFDVIVVEVPTEWNDIDIAPSVVDDEFIGYSISASTDLTDLAQTWNVPGVNFLASRWLAEKFSSNTTDLLDTFANDLTEDGCVIVERIDYDDGLYAGHLDEWQCNEQSEQGRYISLAVIPTYYDASDYMILLGIQVVNDDDWSAVERIFDTFTVIDDLPIEPPNELIGDLDLESTDQPVNQELTNDVGDASTWTILVYMMGDTDLEFFAGTDLEEMLSIDASNKLNLVVLADRSPLDEEFLPGYTNQDFVGLGNWDDTKMLLFGNQEVSILPPLKSVEQGLNMGDADTLANFIEFGLSNFPADRNGLIFWDHGAGWPGMGPDEFEDGIPFLDPSGEYIAGDILNLSEIQTGIKSGLSSVAVEKLDLVGFDACLMATYEVAAAMANLADFMVASEELEPGHGWDYQSLQILNGTSNVSAEELGSHIAKGFQSQAQSFDTDENITLSVLNLTVFDEFQNSMADLLDPLLSDPIPVAPSISRSLNGSSRFGSSPNPDQDSHIVDLGNFVEGLAGIGVDNEIEQTLNVLNRLVVNKVAGVASKRASGLSVYFPKTIGYMDENYLSLDVVPNWKAFLENFLSAGQNIPDMSKAKLDQEVTSTEYYIDSEGLTITANIDSLSQETITEVILYYGVVDPADDMLYFIGEEPGWIYDDGTVSAFYDLSILTMSDGYDTSYAYTYFTVDEDENLYFFDIPLGYMPSNELENDDAPIHDVELSLVIDGDTGDILSEVYYEVDESGQWGELMADPEGAIFPVVQMENDDGSLDWVSASDLWLYADLDALTYSFEPLPEGITVIADLYVYDYGDNSDYVSVETTVPDLSEKN